ncbi:MAG: hypothetical protein ACK46X_15155 [Candidatus Sericytochromatia bacterium]
MHALIALVVAVSAVAAPATQPYADETLGYAVRLPATWAIAPGMLMAATSPLEGPQDRFQESIKVVAADLQPGMTLDGYVKNSLTAWKAIWTVRETRPVTVGGAPGVRLVIDQAMGQAKTRLLKTFVGHGGKVYVITCAAEPARFKAYEGAFDGALESFSFTAIKPPSGPQALTLPGGALQVPPGWTRAMPTMFTRTWGAQRVTLMATVDAGTLALHADAIRGLYQDGELGRIVSDTAVTIGDQAARRLVVVDGDAQDGDTRVRLIREHQGKVLELILRVDSVSPVSADLLREFEAIAATWRWD